MLSRTRPDDTRDWFQVPIIRVMNHRRRLKGAYSAIPVVNSILGWISFPSEPIALEILNTDRIQAIAIKRDGSAKNRPGHILKQVKKNTNETRVKPAAKSKRRREEGFWRVSQFGYKPIRIERFWILVNIFIQGHSSRNIFRRFNTSEIGRPKIGKYC